jgi:hypothetical protein
MRLSEAPQQRCAVASHSGAQERSKLRWCSWADDVRVNALSCNGAVAGNILDHYIASHADRLWGGSYSRCASQVRGWRGGKLAQDDWWSIASPPSFMAPCNWLNYAVRGVSEGRPRYQDGYIFRVWAYTHTHGKLSYVNRLLGLGGSEDDWKEARLWGSSLLPGSDDGASRSSLP